MRRLLLLYNVEIGGGGRLPALLQSCVSNILSTYRIVVSSKLCFCPDNCGDVTRWPKPEKEIRKAFLGRLRRTAMALHADYINKVTGNLEALLQLLKKADGGDFIEGGHSAAVL